MDFFKDMVIKLYCLLIWTFFIPRLMTRSIPPMYPPGQRPPPWIVPSDSNPPPQSTWQPPGGLSHEEWVTCHGMSCEAWRRTEEKVTRIIGMGNPILGADSASGTLLDTRNGSLDGCIYLTEEQADMLLDLESEGSQNQVPEKRKLLDFDEKFHRKWTTFPIKYKFDGKHSAQDQQIIRDAFQSWMDNTCVTFEEVPAQEQVTDNHLIITAELTGCHSFVGKVNFIPQQVNLEPRCLWEFGIPVHEIGHVLGMWHEQQRSDRDGYIRILAENIGYYSGQFTKIPTRSYGVPYDYTSVVHYSGKDGSRNGENTMESWDPLYQASMGQRTGLSFFDAAIINNAYCLDACPNLLPRPCQRGGYQDPTDCFRCKCPDGFGGVYCGEVAPSVNAQCGGDLFVFPGFSVEISSPSFDTDFYSDYQQCSWRLWTFATHRIQLEFDDRFGIYCHSNQQCYHWVEVKYDSNLTLPGPRFCCHQAPAVKLTSETEETVVIFSSNYTTFWDTAKIGFKARITAVQAADSSNSAFTPPSITTTSTTTETTTITTTTTTVPQSTTTTAAPPVSPSGPEVWSWSCTFESREFFNGEYDWCGMIQERSSTDVFDWTATDKWTPSEFTGPNRAYGGRNYIFIETSSPRQLYDNAIIWLPKFWRSGAHCLRFHLHMYGVHINTLSVVVKKDGQRLEKPWSKHGEQGNYWLFAQVYLSLERNDKIGFEAVRGTGYSGDIALDNIELVQGFC